MFSSGLTATEWRPEESVRVAAEWIRDLTREHPRCRFYYILGNHDSYQPFARELDALAVKVENFQWQPSHLRLGDALFLHGDLHLARRDGEPGPTPRELHARVGRNGRTLRLCYRLFVALRAHRLLTAFLHPPRRTAARIFRSRWTAR